MIVACPSCRAKFRIDETKIKPPGVRLRCAKCETLFAVRKRVMGPGAASTTGGGTGESGSAPEGAHRSRSRLVLVAHAEPALLAKMSEILEKENFEVLTSGDGVDALMKIQREHPVAAVIDVALPKMYGFEICEFMKRNDSLRQVKVLLVAAEYNRDRYKRTAANLYGADDVLQEQDLESALAARLLRLLPAVAGSGTVPAGGRPAAAAPVDAPVEEDESTKERRRAERLARIIVSDIALYNPETFEKGVRSGQLANLVRDELEEGYKLFRSRIEAPIANECDFIRQALDAFVEKKRADLGLPAQVEPDGPDESETGEDTVSGEDDPIAGLGTGDEEY